MPIGLQLIWYLANSLPTNRNVIFTEALDSPTILRGGIVLDYYISASPLIINKIAS